MSLTLWFERRQLHLKLHFLFLPPQINFSVEKRWLSDGTVQQVLQNYCMIVIHLNLRGCTSLNSPSFQSICECRTLCLQYGAFARMTKTHSCDHKHEFL